MMICIKSLQYILNAIFFPGVRTFTDPDSIEVQMHLEIQRLTHVWVVPVEEKSVTLIETFIMKIYGACTIQLYIQ